MIHHHRHPSESWDLSVALAALNLIKTPAFAGVTGALA
jgi:hypothetical protein